MEGAAEVLSLPSRAPYMAYFLRTLRRKVEEKHSRFPDRIDIDGLDRIRTFSEFDDRYTARCTASIPHAIIGGKAAACGFWSI